MATESNNHVGNGSNGASRKSAFASLFELLRRKGDDALTNHHYTLDQLLDELSQRENDAPRPGSDPFIKPEYAQDANADNPYPDPSDGNNKEYHKPPYEYLDSDWHLGWTDGRCGQSSSINDEIIKARVQVEAKSDLQMMRGKIAVKGTTISGLKALIARREPRFVSSQQTYEELSKKRSANYLEFSRPLGYSYLAFAILLFVADIPLSLKLVASGFQVPVEADLPSGVPQIGSSTKLLIDHLIFYPWYVFGNFWESLALAGGIAFVGIIVKYYVDLIVLRDRETTRPGVLAIIVLTITLAGFGTTIYFLGNFRAEQQKQSVRREIDASLRKENQENIVFNRTNPNAPPRQVLVGPQMDDEVKTRFDRNQALTGSAWLTQTFIALTILLPVVGGICFSASGSKLRNAKRYRLALGEHQRLETECDRLTLRLKKEEGELLGLQAQLTQTEKDPDALKQRESLKRNLYLHGYARGQTVPQTLDQGDSLYERCEKTVVRLLAHKAIEKLGNS